MYPSNCRRKHNFCDTTKIRKSELSYIALARRALQNMIEQTATAYEKCSLQTLQALKEFCRIIRTTYFEN